MELSQATLAVAGNAAGRFTPEYDRHLRGEATNMKKRDVIIGRLYRLAGRNAIVRVVSKNMYGEFRAVYLWTNTRILLRTARRLRPLNDD